MILNQLRVSRGEAQSFFRFAYLVPLTVYVAFGASALSSVVGMFVVKEHLTLSAAELSRAWFWMTVPWILKIPCAVCIDRFWTWRRTILNLGAALVMASILLMLGIVAQPLALSQFCTLDTAYVASLLLGSCGYALQDIVADGLTVDAVPHTEMSGEPRSQSLIHAEQVWLQTLGRGAGLSGVLLVGLLQWWFFTSDALHASSSGYLWVLGLSLIFPLMTVILSALTPRGHSARTNAPYREQQSILLLGLGYALSVVVLSVSGVRYSQELLFLISAIITAEIVRRVARTLPLQKKELFLGAIVAFVIAGLAPQLGEGVRWWQIDELLLSQRFFTVLSVLTALSALVGITLGTRLVRGRSPVAVAWWCTVLGTAPSLLLLALTAQVLSGRQLLMGGVSVAECVVCIDATLSAPLTQLATLPAIALVATIAASRERATYIAVIATVANVASGGSRLITGYLNSAWVIERGSYEHVPVLISATLLTTLLLASSGYVAARYFRADARTG